MDWNIFRSAGGGGNNKKAEIAAKIREGIVNGELLPGQQLAGATKLGRAFGCSGSPVEGARKQLVKEGLVVVREGHYFVAGDVPASKEVERPNATMVAVEKRIDAAFADLLNES